MSTTLAYILGIVILVIGIGVSVALHELGHMIPAKKFGVKVPEYFIGFGPKIWSFKRGETEYGVKAIWLGGYVKLVGMLPPARPGRPDRRRKDGSLGMVGEARAEALEEIQPGEEHRAFYHLSVPKKLVVMAGGILTNLVLGIVLLAVSTGPGSGLPCALAIERRMPSQQAPSTCPPSSGSRGTRLKANSARLRLPSSMSMVLTRIDRGTAPPPATPPLVAFPAMRPMPTRPTTPLSALRCSTPSAA